MRFLIDQPVSPLVAEWLRSMGHDAQHVRERGMSRATDEEIFALATVDDAVIVTSDLDFPRILALSGKDRPGVVLFRAGNISDVEMLDLMKVVMQRVPAENLRASVVVVSSRALRISALPIRPDRPR